MGFITDSQTIADLNLLGKYKTGSMFNIFNRVKTRGGELLLEDYFKTPLDTAEAINKRSAQIESLKHVKIHLDLNSDQIEMASNYIRSSSRPNNKLASALNCCRLWITEVIYKSEEHNNHKNQILAVRNMLVSARSLAISLRDQRPIDHACKGLQNELEAILSIPLLSQFIARDPSFRVLEIANYQYMLKNLHRRQLERLMSLVYEFDVLLSVAEVASEKRLKFAVAKNTSDELIAAGNLRHPSIPQAVGNDTLINEQNNLMFLTGANMAGKSTFMKTLGVSCYLAHMGFPIAADWMHFQVLQGIYTSINVPDDISQGWSHFYAEVMRVKQVAKAVSCGKKLFILFDELFKGTNVKDAYDATLSVTEKLAKYKTCAFVISTHIIEVGEALKGQDGIQFQFMPTVMNGTKPHYTYKLSPGITADRQGMLIIENERILELLMVKTY